MLEEDYLVTAFEIDLTKNKMKREKAYYNNEENSLLGSLMIQSYKATCVYCTGWLVGCPGGAGYWLEKNCPSL